jgi:HlyD family secretion protein
MKRILKAFLILLLIFLVLSTFWFLYRKSVKPADTFSTEKPRRENIVKKTVANGKIVPRREIAIKPVVSGIITQVLVEAGQEVKKGDLLARIQVVPDMLSLSNAENRVRNAEIGLRNARLNFDRNKPLAEKGVIAEAEMQTFEIALLNAEQEVEAAKDALQVVRDGISQSTRLNSSHVSFMCRSRMPSSA